MGGTVMPETVRRGDFEGRRSTWLWPGRIARGKITLLAGDPGLGKSLVALDIAARLSRGAPWPDGGLEGKVSAEWRTKPATTSGQGIVDSDQFGNPAQGPGLNDARLNEVTEVDGARDDTGKMPVLQESAVPVVRPYIPMHTENWEREMRIAAGVEKRTVPARGPGLNDLSWQGRNNLNGRRELGGEGEPRPRGPPLNWEINWKGGRE